MFSQQQLVTSLVLHTGLICSIHTTIDKSYLVYIFCKCSTTLSFVVVVVVVFCLRVCFMSRNTKVAKYHHENMPI